MPQAACKALAPRPMPSRHMSVSRSDAHGPIRGRQNGNHIRVILVAADTHVRCGSLTVADGAADRRRRSSHTLAAAARSLNIDVIMYAFLLSLSRHGRGIIYKSKLDFRLFSLQRAALARCSTVNWTRPLRDASAATWTVGTALAGMATRMAMTMRTARMVRIVCMVLSRCFYTHSTGQSNPLTPTKNTPKRRLASQSGIADGFGLSKKGSVLRKICIVPLYGWVFLTRIRSGYQVALEPVVHLALQNHCYCHL